MPKNQMSQQLFRKALAAFPYKLFYHNVTQGSFEPNEYNYRYYAEEFTFVAGHILGKELIAKGKIEIWGGKDELQNITAQFSTTSSEAWHEKDAMTTETLTIEGLYDVQRNVWELSTI